MIENELDRIDNQLAIKIDNQPAIKINYELDINSTFNSTFKLDNWSIYKLMAGLL
jgi:hypothetical protein